MTKTTKTINPTDATTTLPDDFDPMELAAFLDGEDNADMATALIQSPALQAVAAAGLDTAVVADAAAAQSLAERAQPLARRTAATDPATAGEGMLARLTSWLGADWRGVTAGAVLGVFGFGAGLAGGLGLGDVGVNSDDILNSASALELFAFDSSAETTNIYAADAFESVFGSLE